MILQPRNFQKTNFLVTPNQKLSEFKEEAPLATRFPLLHRLSHRKNAMVKYGIRVALSETYSLVEI